MRDQDVMWNSSLSCLLRNFLSINSTQPTFKLIDTIPPDSVITIFIWILFFSLASNFNHFFYFSPLGAYIHFSFLAQTLPPPWKFSSHLCWELLLELFLLEISRALCLFYNNSTIKTHCLYVFFPLDCKLPGGRLFLIYFYLSSWHYLWIHSLLFLSVPKYYLEW